MTDREYEEYETLVRRLVEALIGTAFPAAVVAGGAKNKLLGASGFPHQIDASVQTHDLLVLIECKYWKRSVRAELVLTLASRLADI
jgi:hypothetical protein